MVSTTSVVRLRILTDLDLPSLQSVGVRAGWLAGQSICGLRAAGRAAAALLAV